MPGRTNQRTGRKTPKTRGQGKKRSKRNRSRGGMPNPYVSMVLDPCKSELVPGIYGSSEGLLSRLKTTYQIPALEPGFPGSTCGYVLWCPDFCTNLAVTPAPLPGVPLGANMYVWQSDDSSTSPANTASQPFGIVLDPASQGSPTTKQLPDPAGQLASSDIVADTRVLSACMQMTYLGKMMDSSGEVGFISNLPAEMLVSGQSGSNDPCSVNDLMAYCNTKQRLGVDTLEIVYRLNELSSDHFRRSDDALIGFTPGIPNTVSSVDESAHVLSPRVFGFVWRNTQPDAGLVFDMTKSVEWRAETGSGLTQVPVVTLGPSKIAAVNNAIDRASKASGRNLWERTMGSMTSASAMISKLALTGASISQSMDSSMGSINKVLSSPALKLGGKLAMALL